MWFDVICTFFSSKLFQFCTTPLIFRRDQARSGEESHARGNRIRNLFKLLRQDLQSANTVGDWQRASSAEKHGISWNSNFKKHTGSFGSLVGKASSPLASAVGTALMSQNWFEKIRFNCIGKGQSMAHATTPCWIPKCTMQQERNGAFFSQDFQSAGWSHLGFKTLHESHQALPWRTLIHVHWSTLIPSISKCANIGRSWRHTRASSSMFFQRSGKLRERAHHTGILHFAGPTCFHLESQKHRIFWSFWENAVMISFFGKILFLPVMTKKMVKSK